MSRLIDADALKFTEYLGMDEPVISKSEIDAAPTVEPKRGEWVSVTERMPKHGYVYWVADGYTIKTAYLDGAMDWVDSGNHILKHVTHWMPLHEYDMRTGEK